jgi:hypothetical protein
MKTGERLKFVGLLIGLLGTQGCAAMGGGTPTLAFPEYRLEPGPTATQQKSDIEISVKPIRISDIYQYPDLFGFRLEDFPDYADNTTLKRGYPVGPEGLQWDYPFATPDGQEQLSMYRVRIDNGTDHILRMRDARVYLITEAREPAALSDFNELLQWADYFEQKNKYLPRGFYRAFVLSHRPSFKLINDLGQEVLPGFAFEGLLLFPLVPRTSASATVSFFDITVTTDAAGNPVEKTRFDFPLVRETAQMWYDRSEQMWKAGAPPGGS